MKICTFFRRLSYFDRYFPQFHAIAKRVEALHIFYLTGIPQPSWMFNTNIHFHRFKLKWSPHKVMSIFFSREAFFKAAEKYNPDVYYALSDSWQQEYIRYCAERSGKPFAVRVRGNHHEVERYIKSKWWSRKVRMILRERSFRKANVIIPINERNRQNILSWDYNERVSTPVVPGVDFDQFKIDGYYRYREHEYRRIHDHYFDWFRDHEYNRLHKHYSYVVGYAGRLALEKGVDLIEPTAEALPDVLFLIAGRIDVKLPLGSNIRHVGYVPHESMNDYYNAIDTLFLPSKTEGVPLVFLEAYACHRNIVTSRQVFPEELPLYGVLVEEPDPEAFADALMKAKDLPPRDIRSEIMGFTWDAFGENIVNILEELL